jgi:myo-inositol 2-dehydrogenase / D-chiro-inositol 1-dehydrogenase
MKKSKISRRAFLGTASTVGAAGIVAPSLLAGCSSSSESAKPKVQGKLSELPEFAWLDKAPDGKVLKAGIIGCGGRGSGAAINFLNAGPNLQVTALGDTFKDRIDSTRERIKKDKGQEVPPENCFVGFDAFQKVIDSGIDIVILATPPYFRPEHLAAAVAAKKHIFAEKPVCVDPVGARSVMATAEKAKALGLTIVTGTQRRHERDYVAAYNHVKAGNIGEVVGGNVYWNQSKLWHRENDPKWSEMEWMIRDWVNWCWLSGDHIVEQHLHNIDVMNWFSGSHPVKAVGMGSRLRRINGDQYDFFSVDYTFGSGMHFASMCRQINGCVNNVSEKIQGTKATVISSPRNVSINDLAGNEIWKYTYPLDADGKQAPGKMLDPYVQEHIDMVTAIRNDKPFNELENTAISTMTAIMGRVSAYTGKETTWDEMMNSDLKLGPKVIALGKVDVPKEVPVAGEAYKPETKK